MCTPMFIAALFTIARTWKQPKFKDCGLAGAIFRYNYFSFSLKVYSHILIAMQTANIELPNQHRAPNEDFSLNVADSHASSHIPPILPPHLIKRMRNLPQRVLLHSFDELLKHIPPLPRRRL